MKSDLPKKLRIFGKSWEVGKTYSQDLPWVGRTFKHLNQIEIADGQPPGEELDTVMHELIHAAFHAVQVQLPEEMEEHIAGTLGSALAGILLDNPQLIAYIDAKAKECK
jgi:hypothetical protein